MKRNPVLTATCVLILLLFFTSGEAEAGISRSVHHFAQIGDGGGLRTIFLVQNSNPESVDLVLELFSDEGAPLELTVNGAKLSRLERTIGPGEALRLGTGGATATPQPGWAKLTATRPLGAQVFFEIVSGGNIVTQAAVESTSPLRSARAFLQLQGGGQTGLAVASLSTSGSTRVTVRATDSTGAELGTAELVLPPFGHRALFLPELIAGLGSVEVGTIEIRASGPIVITILQQTGLVIGSLPVIL